MRNLTIKFLTLGCKVNQYDTQSIRERFLHKGFREILNGNPADIYLIDTCTVTAIADRKSRNIIQHCIKENPRAKVIVTGCLVENDARKLTDIKGIYFLVSKRFFPSGISNFCGHTRAFLKIQNGCNNSCSYCKVPRVRGASRSKPVNEIIQEANRLVKNGFKELVLCGICLGSFGKDLVPQENLIDVINAIERIDGLLRIRLSSIEASDIQVALLEKMSLSKKLCRHLHIPLQSGDDEILKKMNRKFSRQEYANLIKKIKAYVPEIAITTDVLVGFPSEADENFHNTVKIIQEIIPLRTHIFSYSRREGTPAAKNFKEKLDYKIIKARIDYLKGVAQACSFDYRRRFLNKNAQVLVEGNLKENKGWWQGHTDNYIKVQIKSGKNIRNQLVLARLKKINKDCIEADLLGSRKQI